MSFCFNGLTFDNCTVDIPKDTGGSEEYAAEKDSKTSNAIEKIDDLINKTIKVPNSETDPEDLHKLFINTKEGSNNFNIVKQLFANTGIDFYHNSKNESGGGMDANSGLNMKNGRGEVVPLTRKVFSDLFNTYINYNCYIDLYDCKSALLPENDSILSITLDSENVDIYIQLRDKECIEGSKGNVNLIKSDNVTLNFYNPWNYYGGCITRKEAATTESGRVTNIVQHYDGNAFTQYKITFQSGASDNDKKKDLTSSEIVKYEVKCNNFSTNNVKLVVDEFKVTKEGDCDNKTDVLAEKITLGNFENHGGTIRQKTLKKGDFIN